MISMEEINKIFLLQEEYLGKQKPINKLNPIVSIRVNTYQHVNFIKECLNSILMQQTNFEYEIVLGEDESTDGTREICIEYAKKHPTGQIHTSCRSKSIFWRQILSMPGVFMRHNKF